MRPLLLRCRTLTPGKETPIPALNKRLNNMKKKRQKQGAHSRIARRNDLIRGIKGGRGLTIVKIVWYVGEVIIIGC